jgi:hypothetical protein
LPRYRGQAVQRRRPWGREALETIVDPVARLSKADHRRQLTAISQRCALAQYAAVAGDA